MMQSPRDTNVNETVTRHVIGGFHQAAEEMIGSQRTQSGCTSGRELLQWVRGSQRLLPTNNTMTPPSPYWKCLPGLGCYQPIGKQLPSGLWHDNHDRSKTSLKTSSSARPEDPVNRFSQHLSLLPKKCHLNVIYAMTLLLPAHGRQRIAQIAVGVSWILQGTGTILFFSLIVRGPGVP